MRKQNRSGVILLVNLCAFFRLTTLLLGLRWSGFLIFVSFCENWQADGGRRGRVYLHEESERTEFKAVGHSWDFTKGHEGERRWR